MDPKYGDLQKAIFDGDTEAGVAHALALAEAGTAPVRIFTDCIEGTLVKVGDKFSRLHIFLPEMIKSADVVKAIQEALLPYLESEQTQMVKGKVVIGTVSGDLHDIGKNIVKIMLEVNGFEVLDLGVDVTPQVFARNADDFGTNIVALSALMLPSLPYAQDVIDILRENEKYKGRFKVMVGGGPVSQEWAQKAGADGYGDNAVDAVKMALALLDAPA